MNNMCIILYRLSTQISYTCTITVTCKGRGEWLQLWVEWLISKELKDVCLTVIPPQWTSLSRVFNMAVKEPGWVGFTEALSFFQLNSKKEEKMLNMLIKELTSLHFNVEDVWIRISGFKHIVIKPIAKIGQAPQHEQNHLCPLHACA